VAVPAATTIFEREKFMLLQSGYFFTKSIKTQRAGNGLVAMALMLCIIMSVVSVTSAKLVGNIFSGMDKSRTDAQAAQYAEDAAIYVKSRSYDSLAGQAKADIQGTNYQEEIILGTENTSETDNIKSRKLTINIYFKGDTAQATKLLPRSSLIVTRYSRESSDVPNGTILPWKGNLAQIPLGYYICDGTNGTPDLRNRFIVGAGGSYQLGATGGSDKVTLKVDELPSHSHAGTVSGQTGDAGQHTHRVMEYGGMPGVNGSWNSSHIYSLVSGQSNWWTGWAGNHSHSFTVSIGAAGGNQAHENRPPYYALFFIMKK